MPAAKKITAWSFSRWAQYEECPFKAKLKFIDKLQEPQGEALARGSDIHNKAERYVLGTIKTLPTELKALRPQFKEVRKNGNAEVELSLAFTQQWQKCDWFDMSRAWVRVKIDLIVPEADYVLVVDHKTGRYKALKYEPQLELYAIAGMEHYPTAPRARTQLWFTDQGIVHEENEAGYTRAKLPALKKAWEKRIIPMMSDTKFSPRPGNYCRWCHFSKAKGGPCVF